MKPRILVVGSINMDLTVKANELPKPGETVLGADFKMSPGGKGANQAVAAAKLGADVTLVGRVGDDSFGETLIKNAEKWGVNASYVTKDESASTGVALITVDRKGDNLISVASGANSKVSSSDVDQIGEGVGFFDILLLQLEIPLSVVKYAIEMAHEAGVKVILNPAPARGLPSGLLERVFILTPNEVEAEMTSGIEIKDMKTAKEASERILEMGVKNVVLTLGEEGAVLATERETVQIKGIKVNAIDATGAGDAFCGALAVTIASGKKLKEAVRFANCAGALATTKMGAQEALPTKEELEDLVRRID